MIINLEYSKCCSPAADVFLEHLFLMWDFRKLQRHPVSFSYHVKRILAWSVTFGSVHRCEGWYYAYKHVLKKKRKKVSKWGHLKVRLTGELWNRCMLKWRLFLQLLNTQAPTVTRQITFILGELYLSEKLKMIRLIPDAMEYFYRDDFPSL